MHSHIYKVIFASLIVSWTVSFVSAQESQLPPAPSGFTWLKIDGLVTPILKPDGWFFRQERKGDTDAYFITKEKIVPPGSFETGLSLNVFNKLMKKDGQSQSAFAKLILEKYARDGKVLARKISSPVDSIHFFLQDVLLDGSSKKPVRVHLFLVANERDNRLYFFIFESPNKYWDQAWKTGKVIVRNLFPDMKY